MTDNCFLTILLCTYNRAKLLSPLIENLIKQVKQEERNDLEILLIDNNSSDEDKTKSICINFQKNYHFVSYEFEERQGLAISRNKGIKLAKGKTIVFIDDDILPSENWLREVIKSMQTYPYNAFGGKVIPLWEKEKPEYINLTGFFSLSQKIFPSHDNGEEIRLYPLAQEETNPIGANMWIKKELFKKYGGFREDLGRVGYGGIPCEDTEFCSRLLKNKEPILYYPKSIVFHPVSSYRMSKEFIKSWHYRNGISTVRKGGRGFVVFDILRFLIRLFLFIPYYLFFYCIGKILFSENISLWAKFKFIRILGQLREFLRIWLRLPLKDPVF